MSIGIENATAILTSCDIIPISVTINNLKVSFSLVINDSAPNNASTMTACLNSHAAVANGSVSIPLQGAAMLSPQELADSARTNFLVNGLNIPAPLLGGVFVATKLTEAEPGILPLPGT